MVNRWAIAARPMPGAFALLRARQAPRCCLGPTRRPPPDSTGVPDGLSSASACPLAAPEPPDRDRRHTGTTWPEVERSADSTLIDRESGTVGTDIEATAESRLTADPNSARSDLESSAIFAGADSDYGGADRRLIRRCVACRGRYSCGGQCQARRVRNRLTRSRHRSADLQQRTRRMRLSAEPAASLSPLFPQNSCSPDS